MCNLGIIQLEDKMCKFPDLMVFGGCAFETKIIINNYPNDQETYAEKIINSPGGSGWLCSLTARLIGCSVFLGAAIGNDKNGDYLLSEINKWGISFVGEKIENRASLRFISVIFKGEPIKLYLFDEISDDYTSNLKTNNNCDILIVAYNRPELIFKINEKYSKLKTLKVANYSNSITQFKSDQILKSLLQYDIITFNEKELKIIEDKVGFSENNFINILVENKKYVLKTMGREGACLFYKGGVINKKSNLTEIIDTTGAGDALATSFSIAIKIGFDLEKALGFGVKVSEYICKMIYKSGLEANLLLIDEYIE